MCMRVCMCGSRTLSVTQLDMAARPAGANSHALKIKLKPRKDPFPILTTSPNETQNHSSPAAQHQTIANQQQTISAHANSGEDGKEGGLKRKHPSPTSPSVSKRMCREDSSLSGDSVGIFPASSGLPEVLSERSEQLSAEPLVIKQRLGCHHASITALLQREEQGRVEDEDSRSSRHRSSSIALENISHGQLQVISVVPSSLPTPRLALSGQDDLAQLDSIVRASIDAAVCQQAYPFASWTRPDPQPLKCLKVAVIPAHASWFAWDRIHKLERQAMPQFFFGKSKLPSPESFMQTRNAVIMKYRSNPQTPISVLDIQDISNIGDKELGQILEFLVQWGLVNYQADVNCKTDGFKYPTRVPIYLMEDDMGVLSLPQLSLPSLDYLYHYEPLRAPAMALKSLSTDEDASNIVAENVVKEASGTGLSGSSGNSCTACAGDCSQHHYYCEKQVDYILCPNCYGNGNLGIGMTLADFAPFSGQLEGTDNFDTGSWSDQETLMLLEALEIHGDNWPDVSEFVGTKSKAQCISHFIGLSIEDRFFEDMEVPRSFTTVRSRKVDLHTREELGVKCIDLEAKVPLGFDKPEPMMDAEILGELQGEAEMCVAFEGATNPVMSLIAFLAATVGPRVAAVAAHAALSSLSEEYQAVKGAADKQDQSMLANSTCSMDIAAEKRTNAADFPDEGREKEKHDLEAANHRVLNSNQLSKESLRKVTSSALATAAMKTKLLADQEEREVQRLAAIIVDNQLKKLSTKLKQLGDIDAVLEKEREQMERNRQHFMTERLRCMSNRLGPTGTVPQMPMLGNPTAMNVRPNASLNASCGLPPVMPLGAVMPIMPSGAVLPSTAAMPPAVMPPGMVMPSSAVMPPGAIHPSHMIRPTFFTIGPSGMPIPVSTSMVKPPS